MIGIVGAGIGGLTLALALQQQGRTVRIFEKVAALGEAGAGFTLSPNTTRVLQHLGLNDVLSKSAITPNTQQVRHYQTAEVKSELQRGLESEQKYGAPYWNIHRADCQRALENAVVANDPECLRLNCGIDRLEQTTDRVRLISADQCVFEADFAVACDGIKSVLRSQLFGEVSPEYTGFIAYRGLAKLPAPIADEPDTAVYIAPQRMFARYPLRSMDQVCFVAYVQRQEWEDEGWNIPGSADEIGELFDDFHPEVQKIIAHTTPESCYKTALLAREPLTHCSKGLVTLLGDAAHPVLPFLGQGAAMAIEDAMVLSRAIAESATAGEAFQRYEAARLARCNFVVQQSLAAGHAYQSDSPDRFSSSSHINEESLGLFEYDAMTVAV